MGEKKQLGPDLYLNQGGIKANFFFCLTGWAALPRSVTGPGCPQLP